MDILDLLKQQMTPDVINGLTQKIGAENPQQTEAAVDGALATLVGAMKQTTADPAKGASFLNALDRDHDGSVLDDITGFIGGNFSGNQRAANGMGILNHLMGNKQNGAFDMLSQISGLSSNQSGNLMATLAPLVMGMLGKQRRQATQANAGGFGVSDIFNLLNGSMNNNRQRVQNQSIVEKFLDADGDGSIIDDIAGKVGKGLLNKFFGK